MKGRLLDCTLGDPFSNVALEEALFRLLKAPVLRLWQNQKSVVIGRGQLAWAETDLAYCKEGSVPVVRRFTAGGAVYNGPGNMNWSFLIPRDGSDSAGKIFDAKQVFAAFAGTVMKALAECSVDCAYDPPNRIRNESGKICGMAAYISKDGVICHGTLLVDADLGEVERLTTPRSDKVEGRYPRSRPAKVANCGVEPKRLGMALARASGFDPSPETLSGEEEALAARLVGERYSKDRWNLGDPFSLDDL